MATLTAHGTLDSRDAAHAWLRCARRARAAQRQPPGAAGRRLRRLARPRQRRPRATSRAALDAGAVACLVEAEGAEAFGFERRRASPRCRGLKAAAGDDRRRFFGDPSAQLDVVAVTGTNGKTSTAWWIGAGAGRARPALRRDRHARHRRAAARRASGEHRRPPASPRPTRSRCSTRCADFVDARLRAPARSRPRRSASPSTGSPARASRWRVFTNFTRTTSTTTATWPPTGRPRRSCSPGRACARRWSTSTTRRARRWPPTLARRRARRRCGPYSTRGARRGCARANVALRPRRPGLRPARRRRPACRSRRALIGDYNVCNLLACSARCARSGVAPGRRGARRAPR